MVEEAARFGSAMWVHARLTAPAQDDRWLATQEASELLQWLSTVVRRRAAAVNVSAHERADIAQDGLTLIIRSLSVSRARFAGADNPAALLERVAARAVSAGRHRAGMAGLGGIAPNGQNWRAAYPRHIGGDQARRVLEDLPVIEHEPSRAVELTAFQVAEWVRLNVGVALSSDAADAVVYVLDRLVAGVARASLIRGGHSALATDPAMRHLGFSPAAASGFAVWLLGREDRTRTCPSLLDAATENRAPHSASVAHWRREALRLGFVAETETAAA